MTHTQGEAKGAAKIAPGIFGILNVSEDSFSDGGRFLKPDAAIAHAEKLRSDGADVVDIGAAASHPDARSVPAAVEIDRLAPLLAEMARRNIPVSVDSFSPQVQRWALDKGTQFLNDIQGFPYAELYPALASSTAKLVVMHSVQGLGPATRVAVEASEIIDRISRFFEGRIAALERAGVSRERMIADPGMGLFLGTRRKASFTVLRRLSELKSRIGLPVLISLSRKSFLRTFINRTAQEAGPASLAAELYAVLAQGADYIRTHEPRPLRDALAVWNAIET